MTKAMTKIDELEAAVMELQKRVATLEAQRNHMAEVIFGLLDGTRRHAAVLAVMYGFSEVEDDALKDFFRWAFIQHQDQELTAAKARAEWVARMPPSLRTKLDQVIDAYRKDGELTWLTAIFDAEHPRG